MPPLTPSSTVLQIDRGLATRRTGMRTKGPEAWRVLGEQLGIGTVGQLLHHYPRRYIDRSRVETVRGLRLGEPATIVGTVVKAASRRTRRNQTMVTVTVDDGTGRIDLAFFNQPWASSAYRQGTELAVSGVPKSYGGRLQLANQEVEVLRSGDQDLVHTGRITPIHPATEGISARTIRALLWRAFEQLAPMADPLPAEVVTAESLSSFDDALRRIHFPDDDVELAAARERLKFDELFVLELGVGFRRQRVAAERGGVAHRTDGPRARSLLDALPFEPTGAQRRAMAAVGDAMAAPSPMNLLIQGDVGSGKTLVALHACLTAIDTGFQAAIMAPTEVLAAQHSRSVASLLGPIGARPFLEAAAGPDGPQASLFGEVSDPGPEDAPLRYALLTGAVTGKDRTRILEAIADGDVDLVIGTHALVQEAVRFHALSLAVVDEQHRFGLHQRMALKGKGGGEIDVLIMTATPIPRTLALTYYGDLDVVIVDELPAGRRPVRTLVARSAAERARAEDLVRTQVGEGRQAFVVCAAIDDANRTQVRAAEAEAIRLQTDVFPDLRVELLHGRMRPKAKEAIMDRFRAGDFDLLISTTVIEVGVDVPNAAVMLVENAERFGLAQLHQLRGRIGRGGDDAFCVLFDESDPDNVEARARIDAMASTSDGFVLADEDLRLRGEGTLFDVRQSGMPDLRLARLAEDAELVGRARARAFALLEADPGLAGHEDLLEELRRRFEGSIDWLFRS
ncbi:MAG TPA: ATP-dependent DNA helicase RecG [Actinomycetota bacterium]|nr:ATP-dependent DNA helicase RecG [Actinomycetota bacterium]